MLLCNVAYSAGPPPPPGLPIDGGVLFLAISGIAFGVFKLKRKK